MNIISSQISATNEHQSRFVSQRRETVIQTAPNNQTQTRVNIASLQQSATATATAKATESAPNKSLDEAAYYDKGLFIMKMLLEKMSGKPLELFNPSELFNQIHDIENNAIATIPGSQGGPLPQGPVGNPGDMIQLEQYRFESESNQVAFSGSVTLEDGSESHFNYAVAFSQQHESLSVEVFERQEFKDPLIISFTSKAVELSNKRFEFDIDADQQKDSIPLLEAGHGFLALDRNNDGQINDGNELFGALSGNGFADLAAYDDDNNGFIDENDSVFSQLSVWIKNEGEDKQISLKAANIGAIALENVDTPYTVRNDDEKLAMIRKSGFYLNQDGTPGLIQQLDFIV